MNFLKENPKVEEDIYILLFKWGVILSNIKIILSQIILSQTSQFSQSNRSI